MANSDDPDQTAPLGVGLHCLQMLFVRNIGVQNFRKFTVMEMIQTNM